ncbi:MAG: DsbE family thiol:disulfide interchange protein [Gammaproteobacteria bacterium]|nr:DsbE family thiol:disulfide interchange protein [Gammaproteobacteria bacterium]
MHRYLLPLGLFGALIVFFAFALKQEPAPLPSALIGKPFPSFQLPNVLNPDEKVTDETLRGKVALLNVWASWCSSCMVEHAILSKIKSSTHIPIYGLNYKDEESRAQEWLKKKGSPYEISAFDKEGRVAIELGVYGTPETFILDKHGIIRYRHVGPLSIDVWHETLLPLIQKLER